VSSTASRPVNDWLGRATTGARCDGQTSTTTDGTATYLQKRVEVGSIQSPEGRGGQDRQARASRSGDRGLEGGGFVSKARRSHSQEKLSGWTSRARRVAERDGLNWLARAWPGVCDDRATRGGKERRARRRGRRLSKADARRRVPGQKRRRQRRRSAWEGKAERGSRSRCPSGVGGLCPEFGAFRVGS